MCSLSCFAIVNLLGHRDDGPQITEKVFFSGEHLCFGVFLVGEVLVPKLQKHGILLDKSSLRIMSSFDSFIPIIDELHYVMYRLGQKEAGLQIFYRCLRETEEKFSSHRQVADRLDAKGQHNLLQHREISNYA